MPDEWRDNFMIFLADMGPRPSPEHSIDRKENDKGYYKENCRWATWEEQNNNKGDNRWYEFDGERKTLAQWCRELEISYTKMRYYLNKGMSFHDAADKLCLGRK